MRFVIFLINPFISGVSSLINIKKKGALTWLYLWFIIFGIGFVANNETLDSYRYVQEFDEQSTSWKQYVLDVKEYFTFKSETKDIYTLTVNFLVKNFTTNYHWTFFIYAIVFGFFYIKSLKYLVPYLSKSVFSYLLLFLFCFSNPIFNINGVRFWTAAWIGVFAALKIIVDRNKWYYILLVFTPLIHASFFIWILLILFVQFVPKVRNVWIVLYIISMFVSLGSQMDFLADYSDKLPPFLSNLLWNYTEREEIIDKYTYSSSPLYARILRALPGIMLTVLTLVLVLKQKGMDRNSTFSSLVDKYLVLVTIVNLIAMFVPTVSVRFAKLTIPFLALLWAYNMGKFREENHLLLFVPIAYSYSIIYWLRYVYSVSELYLYTLPAPAIAVKYLFFP